MILGSISAAARRAPLSAAACHHRPATATATATTGVDRSPYSRRCHHATAPAVASAATPTRPLPLPSTQTRWHAAAGGGWTWTGANHPPSQGNSPQQRYQWHVVRREKHSKRQVKRLFKKNPARARVMGRIGEGDGDGGGPSSPHSPASAVPPPPMTEPTYPPVFEFRMLPNGWSAPPGEDFDVPEYPFHVDRTKNKPNGAVGFLPVYTDFRVGGSKVTTLIKKVSGDREAFLRELHVQIDRAIRRRSSDDDDSDAVPPHQRVSRKKAVEICERTGGTIEVNGNFAKEVRAWLAGLGF